MDLIIVALSNMFGFEFFIYDYSLTDFEILLLRLIYLGVVLYLLNVAVPRLIKLFKFVRGVINL